MAFNLTDFISEMRHRGTHPRNRFIVNILPPKSLKFNQRQLTLRAASTVLPGKTVMVNDNIHRFGYGLVDKVAHNTMYQDVPVDFIIDSQHAVTNVFHEWLTMINNADASSRNINYLVKYKDEYATEIEIITYNQRGNQTSKCILHEAFPTSVQDIMLAWDNNDQITILPVNFTYTDYTMSTRL